MKTLLLLGILLLFYAINAFTQDELIRLIAHDTKGLTDTVVFGFKPDATVGIDEAYGEKNIYGQPYKELDMRFIQRTSNITIDDTKYWEYDSCQTITEPFAYNIDSKIDLRNRDWTKIENSFFLSVKAQNFPVVISFKILERFGPEAIPCYSKNEKCENEYLEELIGYSSVKNDTLLVINSITNSSKILSFHPQSTVNIRNIKESALIYPNPFKNELFIESTISNTYCQIFNLNGQKLIEKELIEGMNKISTPNLLKGIYYLKIYSNNNQYFKKIIKD